MKYFLYILHSAIFGKYYIGISNDLEGRIRRHNAEHKGFTGKANDWQLVYFEEYPTRKEARLREITIKGWKSRRMIEKLIGQRSEHPD